MEIWIQTALAELRILKAAAQAEYEAAHTAKLLAEAHWQATRDRSNALDQLTDQFVEFAEAQKDGGAK